MQKDNVRQTLLEEGSKDGGVIAVIDIYGIITSSMEGSDSITSQAVSNTINSILNSGYDIKALIVCVDSPGGEVTASDVIYHELARVKEEGIPVIVQMESMAASGGYYISCLADHIIANPTTLTGSIGVIISGINFKEGMDKLGIRDQTFKSGDFKDMLSMTRDMSEPESIYIQNMVDQSFDRFVSLVSKGRGISREKLAEANAIDGRIISGEDAKKIGLVDSLGYWEDALDTAREKGGAPEASVILFETKPGLLEILSGLGLEAKAPKRISVEIGNTSFPKIKPGMPYLLPHSYVTGAVIQE